MRSSKSRPLTMMSSPSTVGLGDGLLRAEAAPAPCGASTMPGEGTPRMYHQVLAGLIWFSLIRPTMLRLTQPWATMATLRSLPSGAADQEVGQVVTAKGLDQVSWVWASSGV